jgi:branched-chain amino acid aminotransferase
MRMVKAWKVLVDKEAVLLEPFSFKIQPETLNSAAKRLPQGVFTTFRTYAGSKAFLLDSHFDRLENSADLLKYPLVLSRSKLREALRQSLEEFGSGDARIRLVVDLEEQLGTVFIALEPLKLPTMVDYQNGVAVMTCHEKRETPEAKQTAFISVSENLRQQFPREAFEGLLVDENGCIREGFTSNFYAVKDGEVWTPGEGILWGVSRQLLFETVERVKIPLRLKCTPLSEVKNLHEAFLTSSTRAVLPIRKIDDLPIGDGKPGRTTQKLSEVYWQLLLERLEYI